MNAEPADLAAHREVARLGNLFPEPWVISYRTMAGLTFFIARRPGLELMEASARSLEDELWKWERV
ncbi:MAG: hypothetical protein ACRDMI_01610 [Streptosporangiaceae bacterium]